MMLTAMPRRYTKSGPLRIRRKGNWQGTFEVYLTLTLPYLLSPPTPRMQAPHRVRLHVGTQALGQKYTCVGKAAHKPCRY